MTAKFAVRFHIDLPIEIQVYENGGTLPTFVRDLMRTGQKGSKDLSRKECRVGALN